MIEDLVGTNIWRAIRDIEGITEIRMRIARPLLVCTTKGERIYPKCRGVEYIVSKRDIDFVVSKATNMSVYSATDEMTKGYIPVGHFRIGIGGEGVMRGDRLTNVKNISYLVLRIPHQIKGVADSIVDCIFNIDGMRREACNTLVISPTCGGKTTMLRELARLASCWFNVVVIDERFELCAVTNGETSLDIGDVEVISGVPKVLAYENCVRAMNPDIIVTDELFGEKEVSAVCDIVRSGVKVFASLHGEGVDEIAKSMVFAPLLERFDYAVVLSKNPVGRIVDRVRL